MGNIYKELIGNYMLSNAKLEFDQIGMVCWERVVFYGWECICMYLYTGIYQKERPVTHEIIYDCEMHKNGVKSSSKLGQRR